MVAGVIWKRGYYMQAATHQVLSGVLLALLSGVFRVLSVVVVCC